jgi:transposase
MAHKKISDKLKQEVIDYLKEPKASQGKAAKKFGIGVGTVNRISQEHPEGSRLEYSKTKNAVSAHKAYAKEDRLELLRKITKEVEDAIKAGLSPNDLKNLTIAVGTLLDKYRLEEKDMDDTSKGDASDLLNQMKKGDVRPT